MNWDDARFLLALGRSRNVSDAARALGVSHTTVARRLEALQRALDVRLLDRMPEGPRLTPEAAELARLAEPMEAAADAIERRLAGAEQRLVGRVRVTTTEALGARLLAPRLAELAGRHRGLTIELVPDPALAEAAAAGGGVVHGPADGSRWRVRRRLRLRENSQAHGSDRRRSPPREGPALLQGLVICGICGERMTVRYNHRNGKSLPTYMCQRRGIERAEPFCQMIPGANIDAAVGRLLVEAVTPMALEATLTVQQQLQSRVDEAERLRSRQVERARYEADLARRRFMQVDPDNRLVADELEAEWNRKLRDLTNAQEEYERRRQGDKAVLNEEQRARILALATDLPKLWQEPTTPDRERKRMVRLLVEDVTLSKGPQVTAQVRFRGGATTKLTVPRALSAWEMRQTNPEAMAEIDKLLDHHTDAEIAAMLNERGYETGTGKTFSPWTVWRLRTGYKLRSRYDRLRAAGMLDQVELAKRLGVHPDTIKVWRRAGLLRSHAYNDKGQHLFEPPGADAPVRKTWKGIEDSKRRRRLAANPTEEKQYEA